MQGVGPAVCLGNDIDTDLIIAGRYLRTKDRSVWAEHVFEDLNPALAGRLPGAIIVAGRNMGCGSSREQAVVALREAGVVGVVAESFARIFFRNAVNVGLPVIEAPVSSCTDGARVAFDLDAGFVDVDGERYSARPLSPKMVAILRAGGLVPYWRSRR
ncbi:LeuD/DmdB family oxidoreductase small subunit [Methanoculleus sp. 7T]|jgi:methanogen homoaconitase small subunit|uniref:LeuD/DmdB family oxidoreductase small subunit n=1 Tax=Methanoculleus sp. 7T TaxID=2937282 RepID=UPI0020BE48B8|nr:3-isopropylmalate dehydratase [Methanoculleus sp. 7T]MCK8517953.1 3-isopropylmalate dehydratase [Methanoculleus sp. 7T]